MWRELITFIWLAALSVSDIRERKVPVWLLWAGGITAAGILLYRAARGEADPVQTVRALLPGAALFLLAVGTKKAGGADGTVLLILGVLEGDRGCLTVCFGSLVLIAFFSGVLLVMKKVRRNTKVPFVPFLTAGWLILICGRRGLAG